jgi:hypothetical protein
VTPQEVVRHELGHHVAFNRLNTPWTAVNWGPKAWATDQDVCARGPLDGDLAVTISLPKGGYHDVVLLGPDGVTVLARGLWAGTTVQRITTTVCGRRPLTLRITRHGSVGRVAVVVSTP